MPQRARSSPRRPQSGLEEKTEEPIVDGAGDSARCIAFLGVDGATRDVLVPPRLATQMVD